MTQALFQLMNSRLQIPPYLCRLLNISSPFVFAPGQCMKAFRASSSVSSLTLMLSYLISNHHLCGVRAGVPVYARSPDAPPPSLLSMHLCAVLIFYRLSLIFCLWVLVAHVSSSVCSPRLVSLFYSQRSTSKHRTRLPPPAVVTAFVSTLTPNQWP